MLAALSFAFQAYFEYDAKKSGGVTISHLRFGPKPNLAPPLGFRLAFGNGYMNCTNTSFYVHVCLYMIFKVLLKMGNSFMRQLFYLLL